MKKLFLITLALGLAGISYSQIAKDFTFGASLDLIKSDNDGFFEKMQAGAELNYHISKKFTATIGGEFWTANADEASFVIGSRWYPIPEAFLRLRGLIGENDVSIGGGWLKPLTESLRFEAMGDIYFEGEIAIRAGITYIIRRKN